MAKKKQSRFLTRLKGKLKRYATLVYDIESKDGDSQKRGFTRPFLLWAYDGNEHRCFEQPERLRHRSWKEAPWLDEGGIIDQFMRYALGEDLCGYCEARNERALELRAQVNGDADEIKANPVKLCSDCIEARKRFSKKRCRIYAHNGGRFDALFIPSWLQRHSDKFLFEISGPESRIQQLTVWRRGADKRKESYVFLDSVANLQMSLKAAGKTFLGKDEGKIDIDLDLHESNPAWKVYNRRDCEVLYNVIETFNTRIIALGGDVGITAPATAMSLFRHKYLKYAVRRNKHFKACEEGRVPPEIDDDGNVLECRGCLHRFVREAYYGGRTEIFMEEATDVRYFDINSSYPRSMMDPMPTGKATEIGPNQVLSVYRAMRKRKIGFMECEVEIPPDCVIPPLPVRLPNKLIFPRTLSDEEAVALGMTPGSQVLRGVWDWDELCLLEHPRVKGRITKVIRSVWFEQSTMFVDMVDSLYGMRQQAKKDKDLGLDFLTKLMMNATYGKFGMRIERGLLKMIRLGDPPPLNGRPLDNDPDNALIWEVPTIVDGPYVIPQVAAHVTSLARIRLFHGMMSVLDQGGEVAYCDTDSVMCVNAEVRPIDEYILGYWKEEYPGILLDGTFVLPKLYQLRMHDPGCLDHDRPVEEGGCPGCRWTLAFEDHETKEKWKVVLDPNTNPGFYSEPRPEELMLAGQSSHGALEVTVKRPTIEKMKGFPYSMQDEKHWRLAMPISRGGLGERIYFEQLTQHRTMMRNHLEGPRVYRGIPGENVPESVTTLPVYYRELAEKALAAGDSAHVLRVCNRIRKEVGPSAEPVCRDVLEAEKYRARFKAIRTDYDKREVTRGGRTRPLAVMTGEDGTTVVMPQPALDPPSEEAS